MAISPELIERAKDLGRHRTKKEAVTAALEEYIRRRRAEDIIGMFGTIDYDPDYDPKELRRRDKPV